MSIAKLVACILMIPHPGLYFKLQKPRPFSRLWTVVFMMPVVFGKEEGSCGDNCTVSFWRSTGYPSDFQRYNYHRGCAAVFLCGEEGMKNEIEVVI